MNDFDSDRELLKLCREAFEKIVTAPRARTLLKRIHEKPAQYAGDGRTLLARHMHERISKHLGLRDHML
jgi:hypothetical protein